MANEFVVHSVATVDLIREVIAGVYTRLRGALVRTEIKRY